MEISDDLMHLPKRAAEYIAEHGWIQDQLEDFTTGRVCLIGALYKVGGECSIEPRIAGAVLANHGYRASWNDTAGRTAEEVITALHGVTVTESEMANAYGPDWEHVVELHRATIRAPEEVLNKLYLHQGSISWDSARAVLGEDRYSSIIGWQPGVMVMALAARHLIGDVFTQAHYDDLTRSWRELIGPIHPDDPPLVPASNETSLAAALGTPGSEQGG